jgi:hypothetical protein
MKNLYVLFYNFALLSQIESQSIHFYELYFHFHRINSFFTSSKPILSNKFWTVSKQWTSPIPTNKTHPIASDQTNPILSIFLHNLVLSKTFPILIAINPAFTWNKKILQASGFLKHKTSNPRQSEKTSNSSALNSVLL